jgi:hypothetical protein
MGNEFRTENYDYWHLAKADRIWQLMQRIRNLRCQDDSLYRGYDVLSTYGIRGHVDEVVAKLAAIKTEPQQVAAELRQLGAHQAATDALAAGTWTLVAQPGPWLTPAVPPLDELGIKEPPRTDPAVIARIFARPAPDPRI